MIAKAVITEIEPGVVNITTEALHDLLTSAGWFLENERDGERTYSRALHEARPAHPLTQIGRTK